MAKVPYSPVNEQTPGPPPDMRPDPRYAGVAFGSTVNNAVSGFGNAISHLGDVASKNALAQQQLDNEIAAKDADNEFSLYETDRMFNPKNGFLTLKGKEAVSAYPNVREDLVRKRDEIMKTLPNDVAKKLFLQSAQRRIDYAYQGAGRYVISENNRYARETTAARITNLTNDAALNWNDDDLFAKTEAAVKHEVGELNRLRGGDPDSLESETKEAISTLWKQRISRASENDLNVANSLFEKNKSKLLPSDLQDLESKLRSGALKKNSEAGVKARAINEKVKSDLESIEATGQRVAGLTETEVRNHLGVEGVQRWREASAAAYRVWDLTGDIYSVTPEQMQRRLEKITPAPGTSDYEKQATIFNIVREKFQTRLELRKSDPAGSVADDPTVKEFTKSGDYPMVVEARMAAQAAAGIPEAARSPMTLQEVDKYSAPIIRALPGKEREALNQTAEALKKDYGEHWQQAFGYMLKSMRVNAKTAEMAGFVVRQLLNGGIIAPNKLQTEMETNAAEKATQNFEDSSSADPLTGMPYSPIPKVPEPEKKRPLSQRILEGR